MSLTNTHLGLFSFSSHQRIDWSDPALSISIFSSCPIINFNLAFVLHYTVSPIQLVYILLSWQIWYYSGTTILLYSELVFIQWWFLRINYSSCHRMCPIIVTLLFCIALIKAFPLFFLQYLIFMTLSTHLIYNICLQSISQSLQTFSSLSGYYPWITAIKCKSPDKCFYPDKSCFFYNLYISRHEEYISPEKFHLI